MRIVRQRAPERFTVLDNAVLEDERMSYRALGLLAHLLKLPDGWNTDSTELSKGMGREGRDAVRSALDELEANGYIARTKSQDQTTGRWATSMVLRDMPSPEKPASGVRRLENRQSENQALTQSTDQSTTPPPTPSRPRSARREEGEIPKQALAALGDIDELAAELRVSRREKGLPTELWTARAVRRAIAEAVAAGRSPELIPDALRVVAGDPDTRQPGRLRHAGPWWHAAETARLRSSKAARAADARRAAAAAAERRRESCTRCDDTGRLLNRWGRKVACDHLTDDEASA
ncbi:MAG: hypothetical protein JO222_03960 [Frankiales bacterium]|nr:hypothetical protein [Frankiales bacterium]